MSDFQFTTPLELKLASGAPGGVFSGYASVFGGLDSYGDEIAPGAYAKSLKAHKAAGTMPLMLWSHDPSQPIGKWVSLEEDDRGLKVAGQLTLGVQAAREALALMKAGAVSGLSIGYRVPPGGAVVEQRRRLLKEIDLVEVSIVALPADGSARVTDVKSIRTRIDFEKHLKTVGWDNRAAEKLSRGGWPALQKHPDNQADFEALVKRVEEARLELKGN